MFNKLRTRLTLFILGGAIFAIFLVSIIIHITVFNKYDDYMQEEQGSRMNQAIEMIQQFYSSDQGWTGEALNNISTSPLIANFDVIIRDLQNNIVFSHYMESSRLRHHREMMQQMGGRMMGRGAGRRAPEGTGGPLREENYMTETFPLEVNHQPIGSVEIGHVGPFAVSERDISFAKGIKSSIIYAAAASIFLSFLLGYFLSKKFYHPILSITNAANAIRKGKLDTEVEIKEDILELHELSQSINHLAKSLEEQQLLRKRLTSDISHELRTPLTILQSHIEAMSDGIWEPTKERMDLCRNEVARLIKLVGQLQYLTDIEKHQMVIEKKEFSLSQEIAEVIEGFRHTFESKKVYLESNIPKGVMIQGDRDKIKQIIMNLMMNALKFTDAGGKVDVVLKENSATVEIIVADTGVGIDKKDLPFVFERFYRSDQSRSRKTGGSGIGLTIVKLLVDAHDGDIVVESMKGRGSKFIVNLPKK